MPNPESDDLHTVQNAPGGPRKDRRPTGLPGEPDPASTAFDISSLFPHALERFPDGESCVDKWHRQDRADAAERAALIKQIEDGEARQREQNAENLSRHGTTTAPSIPPFGRR